jgi:putative spermidine/putrescine transport system permease protein
MSAAGHVVSAPPVSRAVAAHAIAPRGSGRPWTFYILLAVFSFYVLALYGPMICIYILSFQDVRGRLVFPMKGLSLHWFVDLFTQVRTGDVKGSFDRSVKLAVIVTVITVVVSFLASLAFRRRFRGDGIVFYLMIGSLVAPGLVARRTAVGARRVSAYPDAPGTTSDAARSRHYFRSRHSYAA